MVSIIIVHYKVEKELMACLSSIFKSKPKIKFEIIVVDNDRESKLVTELKEKFSQVKYVKSSGNIGFGAGNNLGTKFALGEYLFFLNPDTLVEEKSIDVLFNFIKHNPQSGMVAPLLLDPSGNTYPNQGSDRYNLKSAIITTSFLNKLFPNNSISRKFFHAGWNKKENEEFDVVPGTAFMISKDLFKKAGMFDDNLFLYFEEYDLAERIRKLQYKNYIIPKAKVVHVWEASVKKGKNIMKIFSKSRFFFFKKHYGVLFAHILNFISNFGKYEFMLGAILSLSLFLGLYRIEELMTFIGDQGWFYLSARDMLINGQIPLVGIASSHPWLHQGAFWTYLLAFFLWVFNFSPVSGAYLAISLGLLSVLGIYILGSMLFSKRVGLIAALLYATSPLAVYCMRLPYHTNPIPFFIIILTMILYKIINGNVKYLPSALLLLAILYNFEIATATLWGVLIYILIYRFLINKKFLKQLINFKIILLSILSLIVPLLPMILYDVRNGFPQTLKFIAWIFYRMFSLFGYGQAQALSMNKIISMIKFLFVNFINLIFASENFISIIILIAFAVWIACVFKRKIGNNSWKLLFLLFFIPFFLILLNQVPSYAYMPVFFSTIILLISAFFDNLMKIKKALIPILVFMVIIVVGNVSFMLKNNFAFSKGMLTLSDRILISKGILDITRNKDYNLRGKGPGSEFASFTMNYEYLTWWLGHAPSRSNESLKIYISESAEGIKIEERILR